jgi:hypothetical protein
MPVIGDLPLVIRVEGLYSFGVKFADAQRQLAALAGGDGGGHVSRDTLRAAIALEFALPGNTSFIVQPSLFTTFGWQKSIVGSGFGGATDKNEWNLLPVVWNTPFVSHAIGCGPVLRSFRFLVDLDGGLKATKPNWWCRTSSRASLQVG